MTAMEERYLRKLCSTSGIRLKPVQSGLLLAVSATFFTDLAALCL